MRPRFLERMQRQSDVLRDVFGDPQNDPPPYPSTHSRSGSSASSFQYRRSRDLSAYQNRLSLGSASNASTASAPPYQQHSRQESSASTATTATTSASSMHYRQSGDGDGRRGEGTTYAFPPPPGYTPSPITTPTHSSFPPISALSRDSLVLVTAANSYLGLHITSQLLDQGFRVRGTVRDAEKAVWTAKLFRNRYGAGRYTTAVIPDMAARGAFDIAVRSCAGVVHVASVTRPSANPHEVITPSIAGSLNALEAAAKEPGVQRVVFTSCASAAVSHDRGVRNVVGVESWNLLDFEDAWGAPSPSDGDGAGRQSARIAAVAASSKMQAEQAVWKWYSQRRPHFVLNTVLPDTLFGAPLSPVHHDQDAYEQEQQHVPPSISLLASLLSSGTNKSAPTSASHPTCGHFVPVSDAAALHLAALLFPDVRNERIFAVSIPWTRKSLRQILERSFPEKMAPPQATGERGTVVEDGRVSPLESPTEEAAELRVGGEGVGGHEGEVGRGEVVAVEEEESMDLTVFTGVERAEELLRRMGRQGWRDLEGSLRGAVEGFL